MADTQRCTQCGICVEECPSGVLEMEASGARATSPQNCIACGHCTAVCPAGAIDNGRAPESGQVEIGDGQAADSKTSEIFLRSRRSVRSYKKDPVPREKLLALLDITRYAPTGSNSQNISFLIVEDTKIVEKAAALTVDWLEQTSAQLNPHYIKDYRKHGIDTVLRGAPHLILATAPADFKNGRENSIFKLAYLELHAPSLGLGSCWAGILEMCINSGYPPLLQLFHVPAGIKITGAVMVGYPKHKFRRLVDRDPLEVDFL